MSEVISRAYSIVRNEVLKGGRLNTLAYLLWGPLGFDY